MSRANDSAYDSAFTDSEAGTLSDIMSDFDLAASINGAVSLNGIDELRELKERFHRTHNHPRLQVLMGQLKYTYI